MLSDPSWMRSYDFDGDGKRDLVDVSFTGGAHCCYRLSVTLSSGSTVLLPFDIDGGYPGGLSLERPQNFTVEVGIDGVAQLVLTIASYGGRLEPIPMAWFRLGVRSHRIAIGLRGGRLKIDNVGWGCGAAVDALTRGRLEVWEGWPPGCDVTELAFALDGTLAPDRDVLLGTARTAAAVDRISMLASDGHPLALQVARRGMRIVRIDLEQPLGTIKTIVEALGPPEARILYTRWGFTHPTGQWVWPSRGLVLYVDRASRIVERAGVFAGTDRQTYQRELRWP